MTENTANREGPTATAEASRNGPLTLSERVRSLKLPERPERSGGAVFPWLLCLILAGTTGFFAWKAFAESAAESGKSPGQSAEVSKGGDRKAAAGARPPAEPGAPVLESKGYIIPISTVQVSPKVGGMVMSLRIEEGKWVKEGEELARIETTEYQKDHDRAEAMHKAAKQRHAELTEYRDKETDQMRAELEDMQSQQRQLELDYQRNTDLMRRGAGTTREYEQAKFAYESMGQRSRRAQLSLDLMIKGPRDARIAAAAAEINQTKADMEKAKWRLDNCIVLAPVSGTILSKKAEKGNQVNPAAFSNGLSASLCEMANLAEMEVDVSVPDRDIGRVFKDQRCVVRAEAFLERGYAGYVSRVMPIADRAKGAVPVRVRILIPAEEEGRFLRPEMGALVTFYGEKSEHIGKPAPPPVVSGK